MVCRLWRKFTVRKQNLATIQGKRLQKFLDDVVLLQYDAASESYIVANGF